MTSRAPGAPAFRIRPVAYWLLSACAVAVAFLVASPLLPDLWRLIVGTLNALLTALAIGSQPSGPADPPATSSGLPSSRYQLRPPGCVLLLSLLILFCRCDSIPPPSSACTAAIVHAAVVCASSVLTGAEAKCLDVRPFTAPAGANDAE
jgi:hypothetical protein